MASHIKGAVSKPAAKTTTTKIPTADDARARSVTDGTVSVGRIVYDGGSHFAFDAHGVLLGEYRSMIQAMRAIPSAAELEKQASAPARHNRSRRARDHADAHHQHHRNRKPGRLAKGTGPKKGRCRYARPSYARA